MSDMFTFRDSLEPTSVRHALVSRPGGGAGEQEAPDLAGFHVHATDGSFGRILDAEYESGQSYLIVQTGGTILSKRVLIPAGLVERVDLDQHTVHVNRSKDDIKRAPEFSEARLRDSAYHAEVADYYRN